MLIIIANGRHPPLECMGESVHLPLQRPSMPRRRSCAILQSVEGHPAAESLEPTVSRSICHLRVQMNQVGVPCSGQVHGYHSHRTISPRQDFIIIANRRHVGGFETMLYLLTLP
jgi:hypothetical protein